MTNAVADAAIIALAVIVVYGVILLCLFIREEREAMKLELRGVKVGETAETTFLTWGTPDKQPAFFDLDADDATAYEEWLQSLDRRVFVSPEKVL